jgi:acylphosphatase
MTADGGSIRQRVIYRGHVQGVCFRATARELARGRRVVGCVRNLPDGSVELEAEGPPAEVAELLHAIERHFAGYIEHTDRTPLPPRGDETRFEIRY